MIYVERCESPSSQFLTPPDPNSKPLKSNPLSAAYLTFVIFGGGLMMDLVSYFLTAYLQQTQKIIV